MAKSRRNDRVRLLGVVRRNRPALLMSTALQATAMLVLSLPADAQPAPNARPTGGSVVAGSATISAAATNTQINQASQRAAINWKSFDVGSQQSVTFAQPSSSAVALNRVTGPDPSQIAGRIDANGQIILVNQSGVNFYKGAQVNAAGVMVSAANISNKNFMAGVMKFDQPGDPNAKIDNQGTITIKQAGLAALVAPRVANSGTITATLGHVVLAGAKTATLDLYGDGMLSLDVTNQVTQAPAGNDALVTNTGVINADGGTVQLTARAADGIVTNLVQAGGKIRAATMGDKTGTIALNGVGGSIVVEGQLSAPGGAPGTTGGAIEVVTNGNVTVAATAKIDASGKAGGGVVAVGTTLARARGGPSVTPTQTAANVAVQKGATIAADATSKGNGGRVTVLSTGTTAFNGAISAKGGPTGGDGGFIETSGHTLTIGTSVTVNAGAMYSTGTAGTWLLDPFDVAITAADLNTSQATAAGTTTFTASANAGTIANTTLGTALGSNNVVVSTTGAGVPPLGTITVSSPINWATANTLTLSADNNILISNTITGTGGGLVLIAGKTTPTGSITISNPISVKALSATAGNAGTINPASAGTAVTTGGGGQTYSSPVVLQQDTTLAETGIGAIHFTKTVDAATAGLEGLTVNAGTGAVTFGGKVGATALKLLTVTGPTTLDADVTTSGAQTYNSAVTLGGAATTYTLSTTNSPITLFGQVTGNTNSLRLSSGTGAQTLSGVTTTGNLVLTTTGTVTLDGGTYTITGGANPYVFPAVKTNGVLALGQATDFGAVTLGSDTTINSSNTAVDFTSTVDAATAGLEGLTVNAGSGTVTFGGKVGTTALKLLTVTGPTTLDADVTTSGAQTYNSAVTLGGSDTLTTTNSAVDFASTVDAATAGLEGLTVNAGTGAVMFGGKVGATALKLLTVTGPTTLDADVTTSGAQTYNSAVTLGGSDTLTTTNSAVDFASTVDAKTAGGQGLTVNAGTGAVTFGGKVGTTALKLLTVTGPTTLDADVTTSGAQTYNSAVTLGGSDTLTTTNSAVDFASTVDAATAGLEGLTVNAGTGAVMFGGKVGATALKLLTVTGPTTLDADVTTSGAQTYNSAVTLGGSDTLTTTNSAVDFASTVDAKTAGGQGLTVNAGTGAVTFGGKVGTTALKLLTVTGPTTLDADVTTSGAQTYNSAVTLGGSDTLTTTNSAVDFASTVDAATAGLEGLTVNAGTGAVTFGGKVGATALKLLTVTGPTTLDADVTTSGAQTYNSAVTLGGSDTLTTTNSAVDFASTVDAATAGLEGLTVNAGTGAVTFGGKVGATALKLLTVTGPTTLDADVTTSGAQTYNSAVTLGGAATTYTLSTTNSPITLFGQVTGNTNSLRLSSGTGAQTLSGVTTTGNLVLTTTGTVTLDGGTYTITGGANPYVFPAVKTNGVLALGQATDFGAVTLGSDTTINSSNTAVDFTSTVDAATAGLEGLTVNAGTGAVTFGGKVGTTALKLLTVTGPTTLDADVTTSGAQTYNSAVTLGGSDTLTTTNSAVDFASTVDAATAGLEGLTVNAGTGAVMFGGKVGATALKLLTVTGPTTLDADVTTSGAQTYNSAVTLGGSDTLTTTNSAVDFASTVDAKTAGGQGLTVNAGTGAVTFGGKVGTTALKLLTVTGPTTLDADVTTSGAQTYNSAVTLGGSDTLTTTNSAVDFASTVDAATAGLEGLTVNAGTGAVTFGGKVGATALKLLTVTGPTTLDADVTTSGAQTYNSAVTLGGSDTLTTTNSAVDFASTVDAATAGLEGLTVNAGTGAVTFGGKVGATALKLLTVTGPTTLDADVTTSGAQTYNSAVTLGGSDTLTTTNSAVDFASTVDAATAGLEGLTVNAGTGAVTFGGKVGTTALKLLTVTGPTTLDADVTTSGAQTYNSAVTLGGSDTLTTTNSAVDFASTVDAATAGLEGLTVNAGTGAVTFGGKVGATALKLLTVTGPTTLDADVITSGAQTYNSAVTLGGSDTLTTTNSAVDFASTVDAATVGLEGLTVNAGTGAVTFGGKVGATALKLLTVTGPTTLDADVTTSGAQTYNSAVTLGGSDTLTTTNSAVDFASTVDAATAGLEGLTVNAGTGAVMFGGKVGATALKLLTVTGPTTLDADVTTSGAQTYNSAVTLGGSDTLTTTNSAVDFASTVDGGFGLTVSAGTGAVTFDKAVGGTVALASLMVTGPTTLDASVTTVGSQTYNSAVMLGATDTLTTTNSAVDFASTVDAKTAGGQGLTVGAGTGAVTFGKAVGGTTALANLTATGDTITLGGNVTVTGVLTLDSTGANSTLAVNTALSADQIALTASGISISGTVSGTTTVTLAASSAGITEAGRVNSALLVGSAATSALLTGANAVTTLGNFTATTGFALTNSPNLAVTGTVNGGSNATITNSGELSIAGAVMGTAVNLTGSAISIAGAVSGPTSVTLTANSGGITEAGSVSTALLSGSAATSASLTQAGNLVGTLGAFSTSAGFALTDNQALVVAGPVTDTGAASTLALTTKIGGITLAGAVSATNSVDLISVGSISQAGGELTAGTLTGSATTSASLTQPVNQITTVSNFTASGFMLNNGADLIITGNVNGGPSVTLVDTKTITVAASGAITGNTVSATANGNFSILGTVQGANSVNLVSNTGSIGEPGTLIANLLTGSAAGDASLTGTSRSNQVAQLGSFTSGGTFTLTDGAGLTIIGPLIAPTIVVDTGSNALTLANQAVITTGGIQRPPGPIPSTGFPPAALTTSGAYFTTSSGFTQNGTSTVLGIGGGPSVLRINAQGSANIAFDPFSGLHGTNSWLILDIGTGQATGQINVKNLDVIHSGQAGGANLAGTVTGLIGPAAAGVAGIQPNPNSNFRLNSCPIGSVNCVLLPTLGVPTANPLNDIYIGTLSNPNEEDDLLLPIVSDQDY